MEKLSGVIEAISGYTEVISKTLLMKKYARELPDTTKPLRLPLIRKEITYQEILDAFWKSINPTDPSGQFNDRGPQYRTAIFYHNEKQKIIAEQSKETLEKSGRFSSPIVTKILPAAAFYPAEEYHQDYYKKSRERYEIYHFHSGRDRFQERHWKESKAQK